MNYSDLSIDGQTYLDGLNVMSSRTVINLLFIRGIKKAHPNEHSKLSLESYYAPLKKRLL